MYCAILYDDNNLFDVN